jgi:hypothetical protein
VTWLSVLAAGGCLTLPRLAVITSRRFERTSTSSTEVPISPRMSTHTHTHTHTHRHT